MKKQSKKIFFVVLLVSLFFVFQQNITQAASEYKLLESFPGFFTAGDKMNTNASNDFPALILAIYKFGIWTVGIAGFFMLVVGGFMYMLSAGNTSSAGSAKKVIVDALVGIVAALGAYVILYVINPELTKITIGESIIKVNVEEAEDAQVNGQNPGTQVLVNGYSLDATVAAAIAKINANGIKTGVTSGLRTLEKQQQLIREHCGGFPATKKCSPPTCLLKNGLSSCPHTTGRAVDIWALDASGKQAITQAQCMSNIAACFNNSYQKKLVAAMKAEGFCVLASEPWHFERPKMSQSCTL